MVEETATFPAALESVDHARRFCQGALAAWGLLACEPVVVTCVTELAANSVIHARSDFQVTVSLDLDGNTLRVGVRDRSPLMPTVKSHSAKATTGRGLHLVAAYADAWGAEPHEHGKTVWCSVRAVATEPIRSSEASRDGSARPETTVGIGDTTPERSISRQGANSRWAA